MSDKTDWARVRAMTDTEIEHAVASDPDTFIPNAKWFDKARINLPKPKETVTLRLDPDIVEWFKHDGRGYQTRINAVLRAFVEAQGHKNKTR
ncbi:BrnA antitoxin family protein [Candidatus Magnetomonas plexicatena]|uniref:BrnA antitoxin family protein n=1 Tax=Candidatus Magnetomonas plexicatena TaxID=2552947 RepID=UPI001C7588EB|nr:BrnA antitoxin family protein [Nitrospirales bacterium LBB_01]